MTMFWQDAQNAWVIGLDGGDCKYGLLASEDSSGKPSLSFAVSKEGAIDLLGLLKDKVGS